MKFSFDIIDECPSKNDRICEKWRRLWRRKSETESWFAPKRERVVCAKGRVAPPPHHCHWTSSSLLIGCWSQSFGFTRSGFVTSCSAVTFSLEQDTLPADLISSGQPLYHDHPVHYHLIHCGLSPSRSNFHLAQSVPDLKVINVVHSNLLPALRWL